MNVSQWKVMDGKKVPLILVRLEEAMVGHTVRY